MAEALTPSDTGAVAGVREAARVLGASTRARRDGVLLALALLLRGATDALLTANAKDVARGEADGLSGVLLDRLTLTPDRIDDIASAVEAVAALPDPLEEVLVHRTLDNGLDLSQVRVPFGVVCVVYEARPNVTADAAAIAIKTGNGIVLRGSRQAVATNAAIVELVHLALQGEGFASECVLAFDPSDRDGFTALIGDPDALDLVIPRGGEALKHYLLQHARMPVLAAAGGNCHVFVDASAPRDMARDIVLNAKTHRPGVCNAAETLLVHEERAHDLLPYLIAHLENAGVELMGGGEEALATEYLDMKMAVTTVPSVEAAIAHVNHYGTGHSEAIVTQDEASARAWVRGVDAAAVYVNASTRFTDGGVFGLGAEVGISTSKFHARGPIGLRELTTTKYIVQGDGQVRT